MASRDSVAGSTSIHNLLSEQIPNARSLQSELSRSPIQQLLLTDPLHRTSLLLAVELGHMEAALQILQHILHTDPRAAASLVVIADAMDRTVLHWSASKSHLQLVQLALSAAGAQLIAFVRGSSRSGDTALHWLLADGKPLVEQVWESFTSGLRCPLISHPQDLDIARLLLNSGADIGQANKAGRSALDLAKARSSASDASPIEVQMWSLLDAAAAARASAAGDRSPPLSPSATPGSASAPMQPLDSVLASAAAKPADAGKKPKLVIKMKEKKPAGLDMSS
jgi:ankyrin repeat protein